MTRLARSLQLFTLSLVSLPFVLHPAPLLAAKDAHPFWTEKSSFLEGDDLFVVGVASNVRTVEEGRQLAFERGKTELMNYAQVSSLDAQGLLIETQMTYEEPNPDGTLTVFRLLRVPVAKLLAIQRRAQAKNRQQELALEQTARELLESQQVLAEKSRQVEQQQREVERLLRHHQAQAQALEAMQRELLVSQQLVAEKASRVEQQQQEVERALRQLRQHLQARGVSPLPPSGSPLADLRRVETVLDQQDQALAAALQRVRQRIEAEKREAHEYRSRICARLVRGMNKTEAQVLLGDPSEMRNTHFWIYGKRDKDKVGIYFNRDDEVFLVDGCKQGDASSYRAP
ncbi:hypothetical protein [Nitrospira sp. Kam-Ns4a]